MAIRKLKNGGRKKALFGSQEAAILAAAGINVAGSLAAAGIGASATKKAAQDQAKATVQAAQRQAQAIKDQSARSKEFQQESQEFIKEQNAENRELQKDIQLQLQMLTGQQNVNDRLEASKIQVKNGGRTKRKLRLAGQSTSLLQGSNNMPFVVTDGGAVIPVGQTPEGYDVYEIIGNDHEHYHKAQGGRNKTGVGIKFADGNVIEGEGNQNSNQGEIMVNTPTNAYFLSKHSIAGFNPAKMIRGGMHPLYAYAIQERLKAANGISDDGKHDSSPVKKKLLGGQPNPLLNIYDQIGPKLGIDTVGDTVVGVAANKTKRQLRNGGKCRRKAIGGTPLWDYNTRRPYTESNSTPTPNWNETAAWDFSSGNWITTQPQTTYNGPEVSTIPAGTIIPVNGGKPSPVNVTPTDNVRSTDNSGTKGLSNGWFSRNADLIGAGLGALGNFGGALITAGANRSAARTIADAQNQAAGMLRDAYNSLTGIDMSSIRREDYAAAHMMPALRAVISHSAQPLSLVDRSLHRRLENAGRYSTSGAAAQNRMARAEIDAQDARNQIHSTDQQQMDDTRNKNIESINEASRVNATLDAEANKNYAGAYLNLLQYNNDIHNQKILGAAGAMAEGAINASQALSQAQTSNAAAWAQALTGSTQGFANSLSSMATRKADLEKVLLGANGDSQASYYANPRMATRREAKNEYDRLVAQYNSIKNSREQGDKDTATILRRRINNIASGRGFNLV